MRQRYELVGSNVEAGDVTRLDAAAAHRTARSKVSREVLGGRVTRNQARLTQQGSLAEWAAQVYVGGRDVVRL